MATKTLEELKQMAIQIRDEKTNKQNTATRIGTQMLEHLTKLEQDFLDKDTTEGKFSELEIRKTKFNIDTTLSDQYRKSLGSAKQGQKIYCNINNLKIQDNFGYLQIYNLTAQKIILSTITENGTYSANIDDDGEILFIINIQGDIYVYCDVECIIYGENSLLDDLREQENKLSNKIENSTYISRDSLSIHETTSSQYRKSLGVIPDNATISVSIKNVSISGDGYGYIQLYNNTTETIIYNTIRADIDFKINIEQGGDILLILNVNGEVTFVFDIEYTFYNSLSLLNDITELSEKIDDDIGILSNITGVGETNKKGYIVESYSYSELFPQSKIIDITLVNNASYSYPKLGILPAGTTIKVVAKNLNFQGTTGFNIQIYDKTNSAILSSFSTGPTGEIEYTLTSETEIWVPINIVGGTLSGDIKVIYGENIYESRLIATWADGMAIKDGILSEITLKAPKGIYEFALGTIDQRNWAIIRKKFSVEKLNDGIETLNVGNKKILVLEGEFLFLYLNVRQEVVQVIVQHDV